jgi:hypothetical protein
MPSISISFAGWVASELTGKTLSVMVNGINEARGIIGPTGPRSPVALVGFFLSKGF